MGYYREQLKFIPFVIAFIAVGLGFNFAPSITMAAIAGVFFVLAVLCMIDDRLLARSGRRAQGIVVDHREEEDCFFPIIEFQDAAGGLHRKATRLGRGIKKPSIGTRVVVVYDPTGKRDCEIDTFWRRWGFAGALLTFCVIFVVGAILK